MPVRIRDGHDNFFTPLRLLMALTVMVGHTAFIGLRGNGDQPAQLIEYGLSYLAVNMFFITSGFLVTKSMLYRGDIAGYSAARILRIYPALIVHLAFVLFIIGPLGTTLPIWEYLTHEGVWKQPLLVLSFIHTDMILPDIFLTNEEQFASAPLWTLRYEALAYIATAVAFSIGFMRNKWMILAQFIVPSIVWFFAMQTGGFEHLPDIVHDATRFAMAYGLGASIYAFRSQLKFDVLGLLGLSTIAVLCFHFKAAEITTNLIMAYGLMFAAYIKLPKYNALQRLSDVSYGVYIYHWCILQLVFYWWPGLNLWALFAVAAPITFALAYGSWHLIEKPAMKAKPQLAMRLRLGKLRQA